MKFSLESFWAFFKDYFQAIRTPEHNRELMFFWFWVSYSVIAILINLLYLGYIGPEEGMNPGLYAPDIILLLR